MLDFLCELYWDKFSLEYFILLPSVSFHQCSTLNFTLPHLLSARQLGETLRTFEQSNALSDIVQRRIIKYFFLMNVRIRSDKVRHTQVQILDSYNEENGQQKFPAFSGRRRFLTVIHITHTARFLIFSVSFKQFAQQNTLTLRLLMSYIYGAPILDVSRSHTTTQHSR